MRVYEYVNDSGVLVVTCPHCITNVDIYEQYDAAGYVFSVEDGLWGTPLSFDVVCSECAEQFYVQAEEIGGDEIDYRTYRNSNEFYQRVLHEPWP